MVTRMEDGNETAILQQNGAISHAYTGNLVSENLKNPESHYGKWQGQSCPKKSTQGY